MKLQFLTLFTILSCQLYGQEHAKSFGFISDNDVYISTTQDEYYTNGLVFSYQFLPKNIPDKLVKRIYTLQVGQYIYTPFKANVLDIADQDRPFAGYLFTNFEVANFYKSQSFFKINYQLGVLGPSSQAENLQKLIHNTFGLGDVNGWEFQIKDQIGVNINVMYLRNLHYFMNNSIDFNVFGQAKIGTIFNEISMGFVSRIGFKRLKEVSNTILFNSNIGSSQPLTKEFYFYIQPQLTYIVSDATLEGSIFSDNSPLTFDPEPLNGSLQFGLKYETERFNLGYGITYQTQSVDNDRNTTHAFGTITVIYLFK